MRLQNQLRVVSSSVTRTNARQLLDDIRQLAPDITARAAEIEAARRIPPDLVEVLKAIGVFRLFVPRSHGGLELDLPTGLEVIEALGRIDGSVGWAAMIGSGGALFAPLLRQNTFDQIYRDGPNAIIAGSVAPAGKAEVMTGGWRVNGRWPFASGCQHADWFIGFCVMTEDGKPIPGRAGAGPLVRGVVLPMRDCQIEDTWHAAGLKGTGSHHVTVKEAVVSEVNFFDFDGTPCHPGALYPSPRHFLPLFHAAESLGMAEGALDELVAHANTGRQQLRAAVPMRESEIFQYELGGVVADLRAAHATFEVQVASHWRHALAGTLKDEALFTQGTQTGAWIASTCVRIADVCFRLAGGSAVYENSPLQRRLRDLHVAAQHATIHRRHHVDAGKLVLGQSLRQLETVGS
jgi:alkylation response protein AidB-like acyl-CoA dehydrogenase